MVSGASWTLPSASSRVLRSLLPPQSCIEMNLHHEWGLRENASPRSALSCVRSPAPCRDSGSQSRHQVSSSSLCSVKPSLCSERVREETPIAATISPSKAYPPISLGWHFL